MNPQFPSVGFAISSARSIGDQIGDNSLRVSQPLTGTTIAFQDFVSRASIGIEVTNIRREGYLIMMQHSVLMRPQWLLCPLLTLTLGSCSGFGNCSYEVRDLDTSSPISVNSAQVRLEENRGSINGTTMSWVVTAPSLKGHVLSAAFKDAADLSTVRLVLPLAPAAQAEITQGSADTRSGANLGGVRDILASGRGVIQLQTDDPTRPTITFALAAHNIGDWFRPNCY